VTWRPVPALHSSLVGGALVLASVAHGADPVSVAGQLLVATEQMGDPRFNRTVIYMVSHDASGALGVIVNRPVGLVEAAVLLKDLGRENRGASGSIRVHDGGPVAPGQGLVLHTEEWRAKDTRVVVSGSVAFTASALVVDAIARGAGPRRSLFVLGHAGWAPHQLEAELAADAWITVTPDEALVFDDEATTKWDRAMAKRKISL
jgi:putative transcriptional regulator